jgi:hypothetical protein
MTQPVVFQPKKFVRRPMVVEGVEVTADNIQDVANWCNGQVRTSGKRGRYIKVPVKRALRDRQTMAYVGDWVLKAGSGFKVYNPKAFKGMFNEQVEEMLDVIERMVSREEEEDDQENDQENSLSEDSLPIGGKNTSFISAS